MLSVSNSQYQFGTNKKETIKPLPSNGKIVKNNIFTAPRIMIEDAKFDAIALKNAVKGNAGDYELGRLNDFGMKLGALLMTIFLVRREPTFKRKLGPLIGVSAFFASMAIWPKLALQLPARLIHGFNIMEEYQDNYGRKKPFYQDTQFIPWDLYSDEYIDKVGDRLKVRKNLPNRRDYIQEKMRKIALQNNTMCMLTAGFATPIMAALISHKLQPAINNLRLNSIKKSLLGDSTGEYAKNNIKKVQEFVNDYTLNIKNSLLDVLKYDTADVNRAKNSGVASTDVLIKNLKANDINAQLEEKISDILQLEEKIQDEGTLKTLTDTKYDLLKLLHISNNKQTDSEALIQLIDNSTTAYKDIFAHYSQPRFRNLKQSIFNSNNANIKNEQVKKAYEQYISDLSIGIEKSTSVPEAQASNLLMRDIANDKFNNRTWFNRVSAIGGSLSLITILSQFLFGRMEDK